MIGEETIDKCGRNSYLLGMKTIVSEKGQVTIPKPLRDSLGLGPGTELDFRESDGKLVAVRIARTDPLRKMLGIVRKADVDRAIAQMRGPSWDPKIDGRVK